MEDTTIADKIVTIIKEAVSKELKANTKTGSPTNLWGTIGVYVEGFFTSKAIAYVCTEDNPLGGGQNGFAIIFDLSVRRATKVINEVKRLIPQNNVLKYKNIIIVYAPLK